jgi:hypothetical protein
MDVQRDVETRSSNHCSSGKAMSITCSGVYTCSLSYPARKALALYYTVICGLFGSTIGYSNVPISIPLRQYPPLVNGRPFLFIYCRYKYTDLKKAVRTETHNSAGKNTRHLNVGLPKHTAQMLFKETLQTAANNPSLYEMQALVRLHKISDVTLAIKASCYDTSVNCSWVGTRWQ